MPEKLATKAKDELGISFSLTVPFRGGRWRWTVIVARAATCACSASAALST